MLDHELIESGTTHTLKVLNNLPYLKTVFEFNGILEIDPSPGSGYLADNTTGIPHWLDGVVPDNYTRFSLHATWS